MRPALQLSPAKVPERPAARRRHLAVGLLLGLAGALSEGCASGIRWRGLTFGPVHADARRDGKLTFVYLKHWTVVACAEFEEQVLESPKVIEALGTDQPLYCAKLDGYANQRLARRWGVERLPGVVILDPGGEVRACFSGEITEGELLSAIRGAVASLSADSRRTRAP